MASSSAGDPTVIETSGIPMALRAFVDTDEQVARRLGSSSAGEAIEKHGVLPFRRLERREVLRAASRSRLVVALALLWPVLRGILEPASS